ncbi:MAG TPA: coproporphyrinogen dehydrogenase HemZ [Clostridiales bacterium]|nr:coproporphyrinogen dehydrogenase HemZ [Clostridiales bacterium]
MKLYLKGHDYRYAVEQILLTLFPKERPEYPGGPPQGERAEISLHRGKTYVTAVCRLHLGGRVHSGSARISRAALTDNLTENRLLQRIIKLSFYRAGMQAGIPKPVWGALTGIRPGKIVTAYLEKGMSEAAALSRFSREYDVSREKALLCLETARAGIRVKEGLTPKDICLYIGIPFCPSRCAYCSFVSLAVEKSMKLISPFLEALYKDIEATAKVVRELGLRVISVYIGGGTPTTLSARQLDELCAKLAKAFDLSALRDYTVEAGRPDTITKEKLEVICRHGVNRVSVNPQTMEDSVLEAIGRRHTAADIVKALEKVRMFSALTVNMDLIAGLPGDTPEGFGRSLDRVLGLSPENITVHTLSLKKGSRIMLEGAALPPAEDVGVMLKCAQEKLQSAGYAPYYLYRQKFISGGFENVGWAKSGFENLYNICIMEELCSIISMGGGASTKLVTGTGRIERIFAPKYSYEYISNIDKVISDKIKIKEFYDGLQS